MNLEVSLQICEKSSNISLHENPSIGCPVVPRVQAYGRADMTKLVIAFGNFANDIKKIKP
jgi:hypothetical protein